MAANKTTRQKRATQATPETGTQNSTVAAAVDAEKNDSRLQPVPASEAGWSEDCLLTGEQEPLIGTPEHDALSILAGWRDNGDLAGDVICQSFTYLTGSPFFKAFMLSAMAPKGAVGDPHWNLGWFAAEMFVAGTLAARREAGLRAPVLEDATLDCAVAANRFYQATQEREGRRRAFEAEAAAAVAEVAAERASSAVAK